MKEAIGHFVGIFRVVCCVFACLFFAASLTDSPRVIEEDVFEMVREEPGELSVLLFGKRYDRGIPIDK